MIRRTGVQHACGLYSTKLPATTWDTWWGYLHLFSVKKRRRNTHRIVFAAQFYLALACNPRQNSKLRLLIFNATGANVCWEFTTTPFKKICYAPCSSHVAHALCVLVPEWGMTANEVIRDSTISYIYIYTFKKHVIPPMHDTYIYSTRPIPRRDLPEDIPGPGLHWLHWASALVVSLVVELMALGKLIQVDLGTQLHDFRKKEMISTKWYPHPNMFILSCLSHVHISNVQFSRPRKWTFFPGPATELGSPSSLKTSWCIRMHSFGHWVVGVLQQLE